MQHVWIQDSKSDCPQEVAWAFRSAAVISPGIVSYENAWIMNSWDRFMIPKPFSRVLLRFGAIFSVPETMSNDQFESFRKELEDDLIKEYESADNYWRK